MPAGLTRSLAAEAIGTFALVFAGCGAIMVDSQTAALGHIGVAISFGLVIMVMIYAVGHISGAHFNPAVTLAFAISRHFPWGRMPALLGRSDRRRDRRRARPARLARGRGARRSDPAGGIERPGVPVGGVLTFFLMFVIMAVATDTRAVGESAAIAIGGTVALDAMFGGPVTGASMNPARSLGPALVSGDLTAIWIYLAAPAAGAAVGALVYQYLRGSRETPVELRPPATAEEPA